MIAANGDINKMKRVIVIVLILAIVAGVTVAGYQFLNPQPYNIAEDTDVEVIAIERDTILATLNAAGRIEPGAEVLVNFEANSGVVTEILVERGQFVTAGTVLARLQADDLELAVRRAEVELARAQAQFDQLFRPPLDEEVASAQAAVESARANLDQVLAGPRQDEIAAAQMSVESARASLDKLMEGPSEDSITVAAANLRRAEIALKEAQWAYDQVSYRGDVGALPQAAQLEQATIDYETALANYNLAVEGPDQADIAAARSQLAQAESNLARLLESPTQAEIATAQSQLAQAEANLARLLEEPDAAEVAAAQAALDTAQIGLEQARLNLAKASLVAPIDGVVTEINIKHGEWPPASQAAMVITDMSAYHIDVEVDELDIGRVAVDQRVVIAVDAIPDEDFAGYVADISPRPTQSASSGIVAYEVTITLDTDDPRLLPGMTADATIETERLENVVVVPNRAVSIDRSKGEPIAYVEKVGDDGQPVRTEIVLGLRGEVVSQVLDGLEAGDQVIIRGLTSQERLRRAFQGG
ncbi:MAG: efflux RND transporter periplasmic adaptor subunit [Anaerolineae bacterium]